MALFETSASDLGSADAAAPAGSVMDGFPSASSGFIRDFAFIQCIRVPYGPVDRSQQKFASLLTWAVR